MPSLHEARRHRRPAELRRCSAQPVQALALLASSTGAQQALLAGRKRSIAH